MSYEIDYIPWLERQKERLTFKYNKIKAERDMLEVENEKLKQQLKETRKFFVDIKVENEKLKEEIKQLKGED